MIDQDTLLPGLTLVRPADGGDSTQQSGNSDLPPGLTLVRPTGGDSAPSPGGRALGPTGPVGPPGNPGPTGIPGGPADAQPAAQPLPEGLTDITPVNPPGKGVLLNPGGGSFEGPSAPGGPMANTPTPPKEKSVEGFAENIIPSGINFIRNGVNAVIHGKETSDALFDLFRGSGQAAARALGRDIPQNEADQAVANLKNYALQRWGSWDRIKEAIYHDPVGMLSDLSAVLSGGGSLIGLADEAGNVGKLGQLGQMGSDVGEAMRVAGKWTNPAYAPTRFAGKLLLPKKVPPAAPPAAAAPAMSPQEIQDAIRQRAYEMFRERTTPPDETSDWLKAEQEVKARVLPKAQPVAAPPAAQNVRGKLLQNIGSYIGGVGVGTVAIEGLKLLTGHLVESVMGGALLGGAVKLIPAFLKSEAGQQMLAQLGPGTKPGNAAAIARAMVPALNSMYRSQMEKAPITVFQHASGGPVRTDPELARIQRERLHFPGIVEMLQRQ